MRQLLYQLLRRLLRKIIGIVCTKLRIKRGSPQREGILVGIHHAEDLPLKFTEKYLGKARQIHFEDPADRQRYGGEAPEPKED